MHWIDTKTNEEAAAVHWGHWDSKVEVIDGSIVSHSRGALNEGGEFWSFALDKVKDQPDERYAIASRALPVPAAWREMAIALRAKIRAKNKAKESIESDLRQLHKLAAMHSFGYAHERDGGNYDKFALLPFKRIAALDLSYDVLGCDALPLLGSTDTKWMKAEWGEPGAHTTARALNRDLYDREMARAEKLQEKHRKDARKKWEAQIDRLYDEGYEDADDEDEIEEPIAPMRMTQPRSAPKRKKGNGLAKMIKSIFRPLS